MRIIDLTMPIEDHFRWKVERRLQSDLAAGDQHQTTWLGMSVHAFTHMDSPRHILADGPTLDDVPLERMVGDCAVVDLSDIEPNTEITEDRIARAATHLRAGDIVLLRACWDRVH
jgi:kynurenine formamidase